MLSQKVQLLDFIEDLRIILTSYYIQKIFQVCLTSLIHLSLFLIQVDRLSSNPPPTEANVTVFAQALSGKTPMLNSATQQHAAKPTMG